MTRRRNRKSFYRKVPHSGPNSSVQFGQQSEPEKVKLAKDGYNEENKTKCDKLYPNCDTTIWLRSCEKEVIEPMIGETKGLVPKWLSGSLIRNGPGSLKVGNSEFDHLFDASALLHRYNIKDGKVTYQNRFLQTETLRKNREAQRIVVTEFGTSSVPDPCHSIFKRVSAMFYNSDHESDNAMISVYPFGDELFAMTEFPVIHQVLPQDLSTGKRINLKEKLGIINHTSHPHVLRDGTVYNLGMAVYSTGPRYCILEFPKHSEPGGSSFDKALIVATVPSRWRFHPSYMHTFGITEHFFIIVEQPLSVSVAAIVKNTITNKPVANALRWYQKAETIIYLVSRETGDLAHTYSTDSLFYLHIINQYEDNDHVVLDICCYKDPSMLDCMYISALKEAQSNPDYAAMFRGRPLRFVLPLKPKDGAMVNENLNTLENTFSQATRLSSGVIFVKPQLLCTIGCETPRINYESNCGKNYRYFYAISSDVDATIPGTLIKVDTKTLTKKTWGEANMYPSEPVFVPRPGGTDEDDGVILSAVVWGKERSRETGLLILDAKSWTEISRSTFTTQGPVPKCLHGWFVNN